MKMFGKDRQGKLQYDINKKQQKYQHCYRGKLINMNILQVKKYYFSINVK